MPYEWDIPIHEPPAQDAPGLAEGGAPIARMHLWPYRSLPKRGFAFVVGLAYALFMVPLAAFVGTLALWWLLAPGLLVIGGLWWFIGKSYRDGEILEELTIWTDQITLTRDGPHRKHAKWSANPHWTTAERHRTGGPVRDYITLKGNGREVEIGAFLHEDERPLLHGDLTRALTLAKSRRA